MNQEQLIKRLEAMLLEITPSSRWFSDKWIIQEELDAIRISPEAYFDWLKSWKNRLEKGPDGKLRCKEGPDGQWKHKEVPTVEVRNESDVA